MAEIAALPNAEAIGAKRFITVQYRGQTLQKLPVDGISGEVSVRMVAWLRSAAIKQDLVDEMPFERLLGLTSADTHLPTSIAVSLLVRVVLGAVSRNQTFPLV